MTNVDSTGGAAMRWELWRLDDNGNQVLIAAFADRSAAEQELARFEKLHHKQTYWLQRAAAGAR
jgi:hypothetical protein